MHCRTEHWFTLALSMQLSISDRVVQLNLNHQSSTVPKFLLQHSLFSLSGSFHRVLFSKSAFHFVDERQARLLTTTIYHLNLPSLLMPLGTALTCKSFTFLADLFHTWTAWDLHQYRCQSWTFHPLPKSLCEVSASTSNAYRCSWSFQFSFFLICLQL